MSTSLHAFSKQSSRHQGERGQIALIILLLIAVVLTIGLSIASRSVMDVKLSRQEEEGSVTFQAAESGVEEALNRDLAAYLVSNPSGVLNLGTVGSANVVANISAQSNVETRVVQGDSLQVNVTGAVAGNQLYINWGQGQSCPNISSVLIRVYNQNGAVYSARNYGYSGGCGTAGEFPNAPDSPDTGYTKQFRLTLQANDKVVSIHPLTADTKMYVRNGNGWSMPTQYFTIRSEATNLNGGEARTIEVTKTVAGHPGILDYTLYSGSSINK